jgi:hypothetical protein
LTKKDSRKVRVNYSKIDSCPCCGTNSTFIAGFLSKKQYAPSAPVRLMKWTGRESRFPEGLPCHVAGKEALPEYCDEWFQKEFKIAVYVDSAGCSDCRLRLSEWKQM